MRELKFRIPHYKNDTDEFSHFSYWGRNVEVNGARGCFQFTSPESNNYASNNKPDEQFTGLKDKNGVEIFEGDIVEWNGFRSIVVWAIHEWSFQSYINGNPNLRQAVCANIGYGDGIVVGNKHENPELLK